MSTAALLLLIFSVLSRQALAFPSTLTITEDVALEDVLTDIPFFSVGLVGFAAFTFFFVMRRLSRLTIYIHLAIVLAFLSSIFDLSQIIRRGSYNTQHGLLLASVKSLIVLRELGFSFSIAFRFLFFWGFIAEPPRGELPLLPVPDDRRPNFISLDSDTTIHSGSWKKWSYFGSVLRWGLLLATAAIPPLQILWRLVTPFMNAGPVYYADSAIEIMLSAVFILKLLANTYLSPLTPRWKILRDYSVVILAMLMQMALGIGNILFFQFSESSLGRLIQAVEMYILILFVLISAFYKMPVRNSVVAELVRRRLGAAYNVTENRQTMFSIVPRPVSTVSNGVADNNNSNSDDNSGRRSIGRRSIAQRISSASVFSSQLLSRRSSQRRVSGGSREKAYGVKKNDEGDDRRLWNQDMAERGQSPVASMRASLEQTPTQTPVAAVKDVPGWRDPAFTSIVQPDIPLSGSTLNRQSSFTSQIKTDGNRDSMPHIIEVESPDDENFLESRLSLGPSASEKTDSRNLTESPIYGLEGIVRTLVADNALRLGTDSFIDSARSSGMGSLMRQQQELDRSIASLKRFSTTSTKLAVPGGHAESVQSEFSLSNFPDPPFLARYSPEPVTPKADKSDQSLPITEPDRSSEGESLLVDDISFQLLAPRMPAVMAESSRPQPGSVPTITRESLDSVLGGSRGVRMDSQGTQYDVTSFIGGLTTPAGITGNMYAARTQIGDIAEMSSSESDNESVIPATIAGLRRVKVTSVEGSKLSGDKDPIVAIANQIASDTGFQRGRADTPVSPLPSPSILSAPSSPLPQPTQLRSPPFNRPRGLPTGIRGRLEISNPIPRNSDSGMLNDRDMFERPRPAPLVLQGPNDTSRAAAAPAEAGKPRRFF